MMTLTDAPRAPRQTPPVSLQVAAMAAAALPFIPNTKRATELARNVAMVMTLSRQVDPDWTMLGEWAEARRAILHRVQHFGLRCSDVSACASAMVRAYHATEKK
jgi:hypothetical protein